MIQEIQDLPQLKPFQEALTAKHDLLIEELWDSPKALLAAIAQKLTGKHVLILTGAKQEEAALFHDFGIFTDAPVVDFPAWETLPSEKVAPSPDIVGERYEVLEKILKKKTPHIVLTSMQASLQKLIAPSYFDSLYFELKVGEGYPFDDLIEHFESMGYERRPVASDKGELAVRGGIIDIFPVSSPDPYRIEFWGDEIESLRIYDPIGQKSIHKVDEISINPAKELELLGNAPKLCTILDYLGPDTIVILDDLVALEDRYAQLKSLSQHDSPFFCSIEEFLDSLENLQKVYLTNSPIENLSPVQVLEKVEGSLYSKENPLYAIGFEMFQRQLKAKRWRSPFMTVRNYLLPENLPEEGLSEEEIFEALKGSDTWRILSAGEVEKASFEEKLAKEGISASVILGYLSSGFTVPESRFVLFPLTEITHRTKIRRQKHRSTYHTPPSESFELTPGDMVVHIQNGIGRFLGVERRPDHNGVMNEFFLIEYANDSRLYVPMNQAHMITKYIGTSDEVPKMHELGSTRWKRAKERTQQAIIGYAADLLDLYAKRSITPGHKFPEDGEDIIAFEDEFPFIETKDQVDAIHSVKQDMCSEKSMDRLVCGDVGYGKTEVAMRASFKAVMDGEKQVAILVPTTMLALQHYENFIERMQDFPINIEMLSRFQKPKKTRKIIEGVAKGTVDILIGTHRITSDDVLFKDLGLVIVDEEQRFGVRVKEHLKKIKIGVECLTLTATPIPRTLYMSLMGARDLSIINTPPQDRVPIKTVIAEMNDNLLKSVLLRELTRDGQAFVIHNRVDTIYNIATRIKKLLPQARVIVGHGQMTPKELDIVFHAFKNGEVDILVATTIVENGIDIPNANTILIDRADRFGLAELYQLRGRVGRWNRQAYAYFLVPSLTTLPAITRRRLSALAETSGYGGGMKVALRDLEIRGAGNVLGEEQSGQVAAIGFHQYCKWLKRAVKTLKGEAPPSLVETKVEAAIDARLPEDYVNEVSLRMEFYQRLGEAISFEEIDEVAEELIDRFGPMPEPAKWLIHLSRVKTAATLKGITSIQIGKVSLTLEKKRGKQVDVKKTLFKKTDNPQNWEEKILEAIREF
ncbi:MAG: Transcription-repair-coupling factor [Chlamydiae bacterium]|nr:Transcription-repair-coupling factor [Chlamydiota bacterium]